MVKKYSQFFLSITLIGDLAIIALSWFFSYYIRFFTSIFPITLGIPPFSYYLYFLVLILAIFTMTLKFSNIYHGILTRRRIDEFVTLIHIVSISVLVIIGATFFYREFSYSRAVMIVFWFVSLLLVFINHEVIKHIIRTRRKKGYNLQKILIVGAGSLSQTLIKTIKSHPEIGFEIIGLLSEQHSNISKVIDGIPVIDHIDNLKKVYDKLLPHQIFIALPINAYHYLEKTISSVANETVDIKVVPDLLRFVLVNPAVDNFDGIPIVSLSESPMWGWNRLTKRVLDIVLSLGLLIVFSPVIVIIAILIKLTSKGPILYKQERMGLDGRSFYILKFRSMAHNAEEATGPTWADKDDKRCTKIGTFLRRTSIDELPQFFNVLKGNMSFVGPRPERPIFVEQFKKSIPLYMLRHKVKTGITGWAQVNGWRGNTSLEKRIEYDLYYIENWSLFFDLKIIWLTIWKGLISKNAY